MSIVQFLQFVELGAIISVADMHEAAGAFHSYSLLIHIIHIVLAYIKKNS